MDLPLSDRRPVGQVLASQADRYGDKPFLLYQDQVISFAALCQRAHRCGRGFWERGVRHGDKVAVFASNRPEFLDAAYGLMSIDAVEVPINTAYKGDLLAYVIDHSDSRAIIIEAEFLDRLVAVQAQIPRLEWVWVLDWGASLPPLPWPAHPFTELYDAPASLPEVGVGPFDLGGIIYTSGTTGPSKGVMCVHHHFNNFSTGWSRALRLTPEDVYYTCLPLFHFAGQFATGYTALITGATFALDKRFSASTFWDAVRRYQATGFMLLGSLCHMLYKQPPSPEDKSHRARFCWSAPAPGGIYGDFEQRFGVRLLEGYGMTETNMPLHMPYDAVRPGSCGQPWGALDVAIVDEHDWPVPPGVTGEIVTRPLLPYVTMTGYYKMPEKTVESWRNLWFHTGDRGYQDADGYFYFVDRMKDTIRRRGENISSYEIERVVDQHPAVLESAAAAVPAEIGEEEVKIVEVRQPGADLTPAALVEFCVQRMAYFMVPRYVEYAPELPKTPNGKVQKHILRTAGITPDTWDREAAAGRRRA